MKALCKIMILALLLNGCAKTASETITETALQQLNAVEQAITPDCKTNAISGQINALRGTIKSQLSVCESEKQKIMADKLRWQAIAVALLIFVGLYVGRKVVG